jgi:hemolysin activation/secretion protein
MQGTAALSVDNPLGAGDLFHASFSHDLERNQGCGSRADSFYYSLPFGIFEPPSLKKSRT